MRFDLPFLRIALVTALLLGTAIYLSGRKQSEVVPASEKLQFIPTQVGQWTGRDLVIGQDILDVLGPGDFLGRLYSRSTHEPPVDLFVAYFPTQQSGSTIHSPKNCLPGAGWTFLTSGTLQLASGGKTLEINRHILGKGSSRLLVLYWYQAHGRAIRSEYWAKFYLVADAIRLNRTDGGLIRITTPIVPGEDETSAERRAVAFAQSIYPEMQRFIPN